MQCQNCSAPLPDQASFCNVCGTSQAAVVLCPQCGASLGPGQKYCIQCGAEASATRVATQDGAQKGIPPAPARGRSNRLPMLIGLVALLLIVAGAGTGKTGTLAARVAHLIESGVAPERILLLTFTRRAAAELMNRAGSLSDSEASARVWGGTFHSVSNTSEHLWQRELK